MVTTFIFSFFYSEPVSKLKAIHDEQENAHNNRHNQQAVL